ncbi:MAG TPA: GxxExxY protein [Gemmataceae bacterium]|nr:GxxExxY protein [Gemmataceae bacterium]
MPIHTKVPIRVLDQEAFHQVDRCVTGLAFAIHNELGRFLDEGLYQGELTRRCRENGFEVEPELQITVSYGTFSKNYFADHLINQGTIVEDKAVSALNPAHKGQALNYLFLCGLHHATLLNFRTERVQHEFVSTRLTPAKRRRYQVVTSQWQPLTPRCRELHDLLQQLLTEWGAYLDPVLYRDAFMHFLGGEERVAREIRVMSGGAVIGTQKMHLLTDDIAFSVTASTHRPGTVLEHQRRFLRHTPLRAIQWINLNHQEIELWTIER